MNITIVIHNKEGTSDNETVPYVAMTSLKKFNWGDSIYESS